MKILLTFTGFRDPYTIGLIGNDEQLGPILSLVKEQRFDKIVLFSTPNTEKNARDTEKALKDTYPKLEIEILDLFIDDPTDYKAIFKGLRSNLTSILEKHGEANYFISVASGTPQMHACWLLLVASGEIPAHILHIRPHRFVSKDKPLISEVDLSSTDFPIIKSKYLALEITESETLDIETVIAKLAIVGDHASIKKALEDGAALSMSNLPILILGETGTGKELLAKFIHNVSDRANKPFVAVNCGAIPNELVENTLFGHKKGSFTGAIKDQKGRFDLANGGTLFLDEVGDLPIATQIKLLRVLQDGIIEPVGAEQGYQVDVRIIAATNMDLTKAIQEGRFREDLYYRLEGGKITLPPLRERRTDIPKITVHILDRVNGKLRRPKHISPDALRRLQNHSWPGNIRELANVIERTAMLLQKESIEAEDLIISNPVILKDPLSLLPEPMEGFSLEEFLSSVRKQLILKAIELSKGNQSEAARLLGISPQAVHKFKSKI